MNPIGIGLAFVVFWLAIGLGLFLTFGGALGLGRARRVYGIAAEHSMTRVAGSALHAVMLVAGLALLAVGAYANYAVLYR